MRRHGRFVDRGSASTPRRGLARRARPHRTAATTIVAPVTSRARSRLYPNEAFVRAGEGGCRLDSIVLARQIRCVDHARLVRRLGKLRPLTLAAVDRALLITLGLIDL